MVFRLLFSCLFLSFVVDRGICQDSIILNLPPEEPEKEVTLSESGPWGQVEYYEIPLPPPDESLDLITIPSQQTEWIFPNLTEDSAKSFLLDVGLNEEVISSLFVAKGVFPDETGARLFPPDDIVFQLPASVRSRVYPKLAVTSHNRFYAHPIYINDSNLSRWFQGSNLSENTIRDIARLAYPTPSQKGFYLSDLPYLLRTTQTNQDEKILLKAILRQHGLIVRLRITSETNIEELANYWTAGFKYKDIMPILDSIAHTDGIDRLEIAHLLPPLPRMHLNTFPTPYDGMSGRFPDWFWTCYNFSRFSPIEIYADSENRDVVLSNEYYPVLPPFSFGDILVFRNGDRLVHGCVNIVDGIVFTKNSSDLFAPWIMMKREDVEAYHSNKGPFEVQGYRKR
ncbi:MAG: hypothetical protein CMO55_02005 [Verrucomicrobiales bacterium]|nr:hypothetical protein [Verrucomicrobiales bacterium]